MKKTIFLRILLAALVLITASCKEKSEPGIVLAPEVPLLKDAQSTSEAIAVLHQGDRIQVVTTKESKDNTGLQLVLAQVDGKEVEGFVSPADVSTLSAVIQETEQCLKQGSKVFLFGPDKQRFCISERLEKFLKSGRLIQGYCSTTQINVSGPNCNIIQGSVVTEEVTRVSFPWRLELSGNEVVFRCPYSFDFQSVMLGNHNVSGEAIVKDTPEGLRQIIEGKLHSLHDPDVYCGD